jgi:hypothetical protein
MEDEYGGFVWSFPCYILARDYAVDQRTGDVVLDDNIRFITPTNAADGEPAVAIFTDLDLAELYQEQGDPALGVKVLEILNPAGLQNFLRLAEANYRMVAIDPTRTVPRFRVAPIAAVLQDLDRLADPGP